MFLGGKQEDQVQKQLEHAEVFGVSLSQDREAA